MSSNLVYQQSSGDPMLLGAAHKELTYVRARTLAADDYITKPFGLVELMVRIEVLLRRSRQATEWSRQGTVERAMTVGSIRVDLTTRSVYRDGKGVPLRPKELDLLIALMRRGGAVVTRTVLLEEVWGYESDVMSRTVDTHVLELRRKLETDPAKPRHIITVRNTGYRFQS